MEQKFQRLDLMDLLTIGNSVSLVTLPQENRSQENHPTIYQA